MSLVVGQIEIAAEEDDMGPCLGLQVGLDDDDDIERLGEARVECNGLIDVGANALFAARFHQVLGRNGMIGDLVAVFAPWPSATVWSVVAEVKGCIVAQFGDQMQRSGLPHHLQGVVVTELSIQNHVSDR